VNPNLFNDDDVIDLNTQRRFQRRDRKRKKKGRSAPQPPPPELLRSMRADADADERALSMSYQPALHEAEWLLQSLRSFYEEGLISDVLFQVQGGKEATVYCCRTGPACPSELLAAKVYRPRKHRNLSNDQMYREGRETLSEEGRTIKQTKHRIMRAVQKRTVFGEKVRHQSWLMYEYKALQELYADGAAVPRPWSANRNAILMDYVGTLDAPAPKLSRLSLPPEEATRLFGEVVDTIDIMLQRALIHGDLSAYNVLYEDGHAVVIDFPQIVRVGVNRHSRALFERDVQRVCDYFSRQGVETDAAALISQLWDRYVQTREGVPEDVAY